MNTQFRTLATQASEYCREKYKDAPGPVPWVWEEKFAELVVEECLKTVYAVHDNLSPMERETCMEVADGILDRFYPTDTLDQIRERVRD